MAKRVLIAGASGLVGYAAVRHFGTLPGWEAVGVSRRVPAGLPEEAELLSVDLLDAEACERVFGAMSNVTHLVYAALQEVPGLMPGWVDPEVIERNASMLRNLFEPLSRAASGLEHVSLLHGTKAYGLHHPSIGAKGVKVPLREREPRREHPNFYFEQEDYLRAKQAEGGWELTTWRPTVIYGDAPGNNMNPIPVIGAYAALLREEGKPLDFPGKPGAPTLREAVDADLVAHALSWATEEPAAWGGTFNLTNGDVFMWENVWPAIAETLGMEAGEARQVSLVEEMPKLAAEWSALVERYRLNSPADLVEYCGYNSLIYADTVLGAPNRPPLPILNSTIAVRQAGFTECMDTEDMFRKWFARLQETGAIPPA
ncbi:MAG: NAD-dependent epimerase/dehydratase family protein [Chloroflexi bacterium]|nr:NAD-dependent epimerase/dehydratase family protein [Chloroflexota bacterium]